MSLTPSRRTIILGTISAAAAQRLGNSARAAVADRAQPGPAAGVNLAGAEFGALLGVHGREYLYPSHGNVDYYRRLGFGLIRLPFKWERLQPRMGEPFATSEQNLLVDIVEYASSTGAAVIVDPHNYAKRRIEDDGWSVEHVIGSPAVPTSAFVDFWSRLATLFAHDDRAWFGLMNEPVGIEADAWLPVVNGTIDAIRRAGARNLVLVPGVAYTGAHSWFSAHNDIMAGVVDPGRYFAFDVHQYFDADSSGTHPDVVSATIGSERIKAFQDWAREYGFKAVLGEFNGGRNSTSYDALHDICREMIANSDVWLGWAAWAGGPRWPPDEMFNLEPWPDGRVREQTAILAQYAGSRSPP